MKIELCCHILVYKPCKDEVLCCRNVGQTATSATQFDVCVMKYIFKSKIHLNIYPELKFVQRI